MEHVEAMQWLALLLIWLAALIGLGYAYEGLTGWKDREWIRRLRGIEKGRREQRG
jgi:hypothetical protein